MFYLDYWNRFSPQDDAGRLAYTIELPVGTSKEKTLTVANDYVLKLREQPDVEAVSIRVGTSGSGSMVEKKIHIARIRAKLLEANDRTRSDQELDHILATAIVHLRW